MATPYSPDPNSPEHQMLTNFIHDFRRASMEYVRRKYMETERWNDAFRGLYTGKVANYLNDVTPPLVFATIMSDVSRKVNAIFGSWPIVTLEGFNDLQAGLAKKNELLINLQLKEADSFAKAVRFFMLADICGTAVGEVGWTTIQRLQQFRTYVPGTQEILEVRDMVTMFDGPDWDVVELPDFWPDPGKTRIRDMAGYVRRYWTDMDDLVELNSKDGLQSFSPQALAELARLGPKTSLHGTDDFMSFSRYRSFNEFMSMRTPQRMRKPVEIWEWRGLVPYELAPDGVRQRVITYANGVVCLRNEPDRVLLGRARAFSYSPTPDPAHFVGIGKAQIAEPLQAAGGRLMSAKLDAYDLFLKPIFVAAEGAIPTQNLTMKPGRVVQAKTKGRSLNEVIMALPTNLQPLAAAYQELGFLDNLIQKGTGISEQAVMGIDTSGQEMTARQYQGQAEAAMSRLALEAMLASVEVVEPIADIFRDMNKTMLSLPKQFSMIGTKAVMNPITGLPLPPETGMISSPNELNHSWSAKAFGPMFMLTKSAQRADALQLAQVMMSNPVWIQIVNWVAMAKKIFSLYDWNTDEMLVQMPQMAALAAQLGMNPMALAGAPGEDPMSSGLGGGSGQSMAPIGPGQEPTDNKPLSVGP